MTGGALVEIGKIVAPHGLKGEVKVILFLEDAARLEDYPLTLQNGTALILESLRGHAEPFIAQFKGVDNRNASEALKGQLFYTPRSALPPPPDDAYYLHDLTGMTLLQNAVAVGVINGFQDYGAGVILECTLKGREELIPFKDGFIGDIDATARTAELLWMPTPDPVRENTSKARKNNI